jgi:hypothetical protein
MSPRSRQYLFAVSPGGHLRKQSGYAEKERSLTCSRFSVPAPGSLDKNEIFIYRLIVSIGWRDVYY